MLPKKIHLIWVGSTLPNESHRPYRQNVQEWKKLNPKWEVNLWMSTEDVRPLDWTYIQKWATRNQIELNPLEEIYSHPILKEWMEQESYYKRYACVSDMARILILKAFGGVYVDTDVRPSTFKKNPLILGAGFCIVYTNTKLRSVVPHAIAMMPEHPIASACIEHIEANFQILKGFNSDWRHSQEPALKYAATLSLTGAIYTMLFQRISGLIINKESLSRFHFPTQLHHEEHNSWISDNVKKKIKKHWHPSDFIEAQKEWVTRQPPFVELEQLQNSYGDCIFNGD